MQSVSKRNGVKEPFDILKVKQSISFACKGENVNPLELESRIDYFMKDGISTADIQANIIQHALQLASPQTPEWLMVAGHALAMDELHSFNQKKLSFHSFIDSNVEKGLYTEDIYLYYTAKDIQELGEYIQYDCDLLHSYASLLTAKKKYQNKLELNQHMHMVNAMRFGQVEPEVTRMQFVKETYDVLSKREFSLATPFMLNLRSGGNTASCFIMALEDDLGSIFDGVRRIAEISKNGGGLGVYLGYLRAKGSMVNGMENAAGTIVQWVKIINDTLVAVNQGGRRAGAGTVALPLWHNDILDFLDMQTEHGDIRMKAYDVFPQVVVNDLFMQRDKLQQKWTTFCPFEVKQKLGIDLRGLYGKEFEAAYLKIESAVEEGKLTVYRVIPNARDLMKQIMRSQFETGLPYVCFADTINEVNPNKGDKEAYGIPCANLCVAPETQILTDNGYIQIQSVVGENVNVWNGKEFSSVKVKKTGTNQKLVRVVTSTGQELECTEYHKFYVMEGYKNVVVKQADELKSGDKLIKFDLPIIEGELELDKSYDNGFMSADGSTCAKGYDRIYLYHGKRNLKKHFTSVNHWCEDENQNRSVGVAKSLKSKYFVPTNEYNVSSRLKWFAGLCDGDGTIARNGTNESIQIVSIHKEFLKEVQLMLQTLGVTSKISMTQEAGLHSLPKNDGSGDYGLFNCKTAYRILVSSTGLFQLANLGFVTNRLVWDYRMPQRCAEQFIMIDEVIDDGRFDDTYCFDEKIRHMGMFNGILTGQCTESYSNVKPDRYTHVCNLGSINLGNIKDKARLAEVSRIACRILNRGVQLTKHPDATTEAHNKRYRTIGIGIMGMNDYLAREFKGYNDLAEIADIAECIEYNAVLESIEIAKELGSFEAFEFSEWKNGNMTWMFHERGNGKYDWSYAQSQIDLYGIHNSQLTSPAPTTSTSIYQDASATYLPIYSAFFSEDNKNGSLKVGAKYLADNPLGYGKTQAKFKAKEIIDITAALQKFTDTGISMELLFDQNKEGFSAKDLYDAIHYAHEKKIKTIYYIRSLKLKENADEGCQACAG